MGNKIIIDGSSRTALINDRGELIEFLDGAGGEGASLVGNIYCGIVRRILPSQFAFVGIGGEKNGFLHLTDQKERFLLDERGKPKFKQGDALLVQVTRDETGEKGVFLSAQISLAGRFLVLIKSGEGAVSVSRKIEDRAERERLKSIINAEIPDGFGVIARTSCQNQTAGEILGDLRELRERFMKIEAVWQSLAPPALVFSEESPVIKNIIDLINEDIDKIIVEDPREYGGLAEYAKRRLPSVSEKLELYGGEIPIFRQFSIESQLARLTQKKVWLKSGGFLYIEKTEACFVIDVNSGKFEGKRDHAGTMLRLNLEAAAEIARQIRLRNLNGIIIVDFIGMRAESDNAALLSALASALKNDRIPAYVADMTALGLVEITRKKTRRSLMK